MLKFQCYSQESEFQREREKVKWEEDMESATGSIKRLQAEQEELMSRSAHPSSSMQNLNVICRIVDLEESLDSVKNERQVFLPFPNYLPFPVHGRVVFPSLKSRTGSAVDSPRTSRCQRRASRAVEMYQLKSVECFREEDVRLSSSRGPAGIFIWLQEVLPLLAKFPS